MCEPDCHTGSLPVVSGRGHSDKKEDMLKMERATGLEPRESANGMIIIQKDSSCQGVIFWCKNDNKKVLILR